MEKLITDLLIASFENGDLVKIKTNKGVIIAPTHIQEINLKTKTVTILKESAIDKMLVVKNISNANEADKAIEAIMNDISNYFELRIPNIASVSVLF